MAGQVSYMEFVAWTQLHDSDARTYLAYDAYRCSGQSLDRWWADNQGRYV